MLPDAHSIGSLRYRLIAGDISLEPLHILKTHELTWHEWQVRLFVLGASHAVCLTRGDAKITELLTCLPPAGNSKPLYETSTEQTKQKCLHRNGLRWEIRLWEYETVNNERRLIERESSLQVEFPATHSVEKPLTRIDWHIHRDMLLIQTLHTYPNQGRSVRSRTKIAPKQTLHRKELL